MPDFPTDFLLYERSANDGWKAKKKGRATLLERLEALALIESEEVLQFHFDAGPAALLPAPLGIGQRKLWSLLIREKDDVKPPYIYLVEFGQLVKEVEADWREDI